MMTRFKQIPGLVMVFVFPHRPGNLIQVQTIWKLRTFQKRLKLNDDSLCAIAFSNLESSHLPGQFGEKPFCCSVCNSGFSDSEALVQHMRIHTRQT
ncbi:hypothetical protein F7725_025841, partial [Dissostichus mawsoni]